MTRAAATGISLALAVAFTVLRDVSGEGPGR